MDIAQRFEQLKQTLAGTDNHQANNYFSVIRELLPLKDQNPEFVGSKIAEMYRQVEDEIKNNDQPPVKPISFGTSGWRGILGKEITVKTVAAVTKAIIKLYVDANTDHELAALLGVESFSEARKKGCLVGFDNRFGGEILGKEVARVLSDYGFTVYYCGESSTGVLSAAVLDRGAAFSVNLTPSHNPLEYGGYKYNAADAGPASGELTSLITKYARQIVTDRDNQILPLPPRGEKGKIEDIDSLQHWFNIVQGNKKVHGIDYDQLLHTIQKKKDQLDIVIDCVHGVSRLHVSRLLKGADEALTIIRGESDVSFGGVAPEPSSENIKTVHSYLQKSKKDLKIGAIIDPDADRIRFTDGITEISMNQFGAMAYYFMMKEKRKQGVVAKTVATSNLANAVASALGETVFEPKVGFKEFKPVIGKALVMFEESDGISIIGHTPEKDAYIGLILALDMVLTSGKNLSELKDEIEKQFGSYWPERDGVLVTVSGEELLNRLAGLEKYQVGTELKVGQEMKTIDKVLSIDGRKMIFSDQSWLMIRPSGTEPKVRFYVESREPEGTKDLVDTARAMLKDLKLIEN
ncbi:MAG: phosphoglucomutase [Desulfobulbaceae bacterium]|nr:MAG: phosphoglucomutase [Desulfobulbaceae bacterium]